MYCRCTVVSDVLVFHMHYDVRRWYVDVDNTCTRHSNCSSARCRYVSLRSALIFWKLQEKYSPGDKMPNSSTVFLINHSRRKLL